MKRWEKVLLCFVLIGIAGIISLCVWQSDNIRAGMIALTKSSDEIAVDMNVGKKEIEEELKKQYPTIVSDFTAEEERMIMKGEITVEEAVEMMQQRYVDLKNESNGVLPTNTAVDGNGKGKTENQGEYSNSDDKDSQKTHDTHKNTENPSKPKETDASQGELKSESKTEGSGDKSKSQDNKNSSGGKTTNNKHSGQQNSGGQSISSSGGEKGSGTVAGGGNSTVDGIVGDKVVELYSLKAYYLGQIGQLEASAKSAYKSLPKEQRNLAGKQSIISSYMSTAMGYMSSCDSQVAGILGQLESELKAINADTSVVGQLRSAYESEKTMKKAYYMSLID